MYISPSFIYRQDGYELSVMNFSSIIQYIALFVQRWGRKAAKQKADIANVQEARRDVCYIVN